MFIVTLLFCFVLVSIDSASQSCYWRLTWSLYHALVGVIVAQHCNFVMSSLVWCAFCSKTTLTSFSFRTMVLKPMIIAGQYYGTASFDVIFLCASGHRTTVVHILRQWLPPHFTHNTQSLDAKRDLLAKTFCALVAKGRRYMDEKCKQVNWFVFFSSFAHEVDGLDSASFLSNTSCRSLLVLCLHLFVPRREASVNNPLSAGAL